MQNRQTYMLSQEEQWLLVEKYQGEKTNGFFTDCQKLAAGEPLAYLIGSIPFLNCQIYLDSRPLIPRPETEFWTEKALAEIKTSSPRSTLGEEVFILDLCAGSGCVGVAVACALPVSNVDFGEINVAHLPTIQKNITENNIDTSRSNIIQSDLFQNITKKYNFILSNPPYIDPALDRTESSVKSHEPHQALYGGQDGLELIHNIIKQAPEHLNRKGQLWIEHEPEQSLAVQTSGQKANFSTTTHKDQYNVERYSVLVLQ